jgi:hypothetical protein
MSALFYCQHNAAADKADQQKGDNDNPVFIQIT